jgi:hypothetical protein
MCKAVYKLSTSPDYNASELASWPPCLYVAPHLSPGLSPRFYVLECLGPDPPSASLVDLWSNTKLAVLDTQPALRDRLAVMASPQVLILVLSIAEILQMCQCVIKSCKKQTYCTIRTFHLIGFHWHACKCAHTLSLATEKCMPQTYNYFWHMRKSCKFCMQIYYLLKREKIVYS